MPHECTDCGHVFPDGSKAMLSGCPDCGGNTFQFRPKSAVLSDDRTGTDGTDEPDRSEPPSVESPEDGDIERTTADADSAGSSPEATSTDGAHESLAAAERSRRGPVGRATAAVREWVRIDSSNPSGVSRSDRADESTSTGSEGGSEPAADSERSPTPPGTESNVETESGPNDSESSPPSGAADGRIASEPSADQPDLDDLRRELNEQFESIRIVEPGQYELNLMELYDRDEYIIALRENGRYVIEAPESWLGRRDRD